MRSRLTQSIGSAPQRFKLHAASVVLLHMVQTRHQPINLSVYTPGAWCHQCPWYLRCFGTLGVSVHQSIGALVLDPWRLCASVPQSLGALGASTPSVLRCPRCLDAPRIGAFGTLGTSVPYGSTPWYFGALGAPEPQRLSASAPSVHRHSLPQCPQCFGASEPLCIGASTSSMLQSLTSFGAQALPAPISSVPSLPKSLCALVLQSLDASVLRRLWCTGTLHRYRWCPLHFGASEPRCIGSSEPSALRSLDALVLQSFGASVLGP
ncbi:UNVERIFIED_CONTAM: hypothetical protein FKN15_062428 [Acipenser sinensis]